MGEHLKRLKELRLQHELSQKDIANYLGITVAAYSFYERGNREPNVSILKKLAEYFNVSLGYLMGMEDEPQTIAAHFDGDEYTEEELNKIREFAEFVKSKRKKDIPQLNAAHQRTDIDIPNNVDTSDDDIMDDENF